MLENIAPSYGC